VEYVKQQATAEGWRPTLELNPKHLLNGATA